MLKKLNLLEHKNTQTTSELLAASKKMGLSVNWENNKFMILSRSIEDQSNLQVDNFTFEKMENLKCLGVNINSQNDHASSYKRNNSKWKPVLS